MARVVLIHWKPAEAGTRTAHLEGAGHRVEVLAPDGSPGLRPLRQDPPDAIVIDLDRLPSHGRAVAIALRRYRDTRRVPLVLAGGSEATTARLRRDLPDAVAAPWRTIRSALRRALSAGAPARPRVVDIMAGYSGTPLPKKLGIKAGQRLALLSAPAGFEATLGALPGDVSIVRHARGKADVILLFSRSRLDLKRRWQAATRMTADGGRLWLAWPKKASGLATDLTQSDVRRTGLERGLVDFKICAIDATWSGLCFVRRRS